MRQARQTEPTLAEIIPIAELRRSALLDGDPSPPPRATFWGPGIAVLLVGLGFWVLLGVLLVHVLTN